MDILRERELILKTERDVQHNSRWNDLPIISRRVVHKVTKYDIGETVWLRGMGPRVITSCHFTESHRPAWITLAEEVGRWNMDDIVKYRVVDTSKVIKFLTKLHWKYVLKEGLKLYVIPIYLTFASACLALLLEIILFYELNFEAGLAFLFGFCGLLITLYSSINNVRLFCLDIGYRKRMQPECAIAAPPRRVEEELRRYLDEEENVPEIEEQFFEDEWLDEWGEVVMNNDF